MKKTKLLFGAHMSTEGGLHTAFERGFFIKCSTIQIFTKNNRQWHVKQLSEEEIKKFKEAQVQFSSINPVVAHAAYLINLASDSPSVRKQSITALYQEIIRCEQLEIPILILHPGSHGTLTNKDGINYLVEGINEAQEKTKKTTFIALETMAGQGTSLGSSFEELATIREQSHNKKNIKVCFDTCHVFTAGYPLHEPAHYETLWRKFEETIGLKNLATIHINDSKKEFNSHVDRHENIGKGKIGFTFFEQLFNDERFFDIPKILETPKTSLHDDLENMIAIKKLISPKNKEVLQMN